MEKLFHRDHSDQAMDEWYKWLTATFLNGRSPDKPIGESNFARPRNGLKAEVAFNFLDRVETTAISSTKPTNTAALRLRAFGARSVEKLDSRSSWSWRLELCLLDS